MAGVDQQRHRVYFTGNLDGPLERHLYWVDYRHPAAPRRVTEAGWWNGAEMDEDAHPRPDQPLQSRPAAASLSRRCGRAAHRLDRGKQARRVASLCALSRRPCPAELRNAPGRRRHQRSTGGCSRRRASPGGIIRSSFRSMAGRGRGGRRPAPGAARSSNIWSSMAGSSSRSTIAARPIAATRSKPPSTTPWAGSRCRTSSPASTGCRARPIVDPHAIAVYGWSYGGYMTLRLLEAAPGTFRRGESPARRSPVGSFTTPIIPNAISAIPRAIPRPIAPPTRSARPTGSPIPCC